jgi:hypothetical protein
MVEKLDLTHIQANQCNSIEVDLHRCGVRQLLKYRHEWGIKKFREFLAKPHNLQSYLTDYEAQFRLGNKGEKGIWLSNSLLEQQGQATLL